jgi:hypothetical protein
MVERVTILLNQGAQFRYALGAADHSSDTRRGIWQLVPDPLPPLLPLHCCCYFWTSGPLLANTLWLKLLCL